MAWEECPRCGLSFDDEQEGFYCVECQETVCVTCYNPLTEVCLACEERMQFGDPADV